jgi:hypothetical protein
VAGALDRTDHFLVPMPESRSFDTLGDLAVRPRGRGALRSGADLIADWWYGRNPRTFANVQNLTATPRDRRLALIGHAQTPNLRHAQECSPDHDLVQVDTVLGAHDDRQR